MAAAVGRHLAKLVTLAQQRREGATGEARAIGEAKRPASRRLCLFDRKLIHDSGDRVSQERIAMIPTLWEYNKDGTVGDPMEALRPYGSTDNRNLERALRVLQSSYRSVLGLFITSCMGDKSLQSAPLETFIAAVTRSIPSTKTSKLCDELSRIRNSAMRLAPDIF